MIVTCTYIIHIKEQTEISPAILRNHYSNILKMCNLKSIAIFVCLCYIACVPAKDCEPIYKLPNWKFDESEPPADLRLGKPSEVAEALEAQVENVREHFFLTLLANPFINEGSKCPPANSSYRDLRKFHMSRYIIKGADESQSIFFSKIFTGCYYVEMTNVEGKQWLWDPIFVSTSYHYYDTMLTCKKFEVKPENSEQSSNLKVELEIPLTCLQVRYQLLELPQITETALADLISGNRRIVQDCLVQNVGNGKLPHVSCRKPNTGRTGFTLSVTHAVEKNEGWGTIITSEFLNKDGTSYYALFEQYSHDCNISYGDLMTWQPTVNFGWISYGFRNGTNTETFGYTNTPLKSRII